MNELKIIEEQEQKLHRNETYEFTKLKQICAFVDDIKNSINEMRIADNKQEQFKKKKKRI